MRWREPPAERPMNRTHILKVPLGDRIECDHGCSGGFCVRTRNSDSESTTPVLECSGCGGTTTKAAT